MKHSSNKRFGMCGFNIDAYNWVFMPKNVFWPALFSCKEMRVQFEQEKH